MEIVLVETVLSGDPLYSSGVPTSYSHSKSALFAVPKYSQGNFRVESLHWRLILMCEAKQIIMVFHRARIDHYVCVPYNSQKGTVVSDDNKYSSF